MLKREVIEDIAILLRGFFATPIISSLGRLGVLDAMNSFSIFTVDDFPAVKNKKLLKDTINYFLRLGLLEIESKKENTYKVSELGSEVFRRANSFYVPHSYFEYMYRYHDFIQDATVKDKCVVERLENVIGSGKTHLRYFPPVISFLKRKVDFDCIVDVGCGDGQFLSSFLKGLGQKKVVGVDISKLSTEATLKNLRREYPSQDISVVCSDALDVKKWSGHVFSVAGKGKIVISMWFLLHEISHNDPVNVINFFKGVSKVFPSSAIAVGEVVCQSNDVLLNNNFRSLMPEYLFFHEMSGQGILFWDEYRHILANIPYDLAFERLFDESASSDDKKIPSTFIWCLFPKGFITESI